MKSTLVCLSFITVLLPAQLNAESYLEPALPTRAIAFIKPPRLLSTSATSNNTSAPATYYFTIALPPDAREPLQKITIKQVSGGQAIRFNLKRTQVFAGKPGQFSALLPSQATTDQSTLVITLTPPIAPGTTFTLALRPLRNPDSEGTYFLEVSAFPAGNHVNSQSLGFGRFQFQRSNGVE